jgi:hypothetical protein
MPKFARPLMIWSVGPSRCAADSTAQHYLKHSIFAGSTLLQVWLHALLQSRLNTSYTFKAAMRAMGGGISTYRRGQS